MWVTDSSRSAAPDAGAMLHAEIERMPREQLRTLQLRRLKATVQNAFDRVPLHRKRFEALGLWPQDLRCLDDLRRLPFTHKSDLRDYYPFGMLARPVHELARLHASSGTTGKPTVVGYTAADLDHWSLLMARSLACVGVKRGDVVHNAYGYGLFTGGLGMHDGAQRLGAVVVPVSGGATERQVQLIIDFNASVLCSTPSYALAITEVAEQQGVNLRKSGLRIGVFGAEPWSAAMRAEIEARMGLKAMDMYGLSEVMGPGVACECACRQGLHGWEDHFVFEIVDPDTGEQLPEGASGELIITTLTKEALPMLRYRTRDLTRLTTTRCDCGRTHARLLRFSGRSDDMLVVRGVNVYPSQIESVLVGLAHLAPHYRLLVDRDGSLDRLSVEVEARAEVPPQSYGTLALDVRRHLKAMVGITTLVTVLAPGVLPRSQGKAQRVRDLQQLGD